MRIIINMCSAIFYRRLHQLKTVLPSPNNTSPHRFMLSHSTFSSSSGKLFPFANNKISNALRLAFCTGLDTPAMRLIRWCSVGTSVIHVEKRGNVTFFHPDGDGNLQHPRNAPKLATSALCGIPRWSEMSAMAFYNFGTRTNRRTWVSATGFFVNLSFFVSNGGDFVELVEDFMRTCVLLSVTVRTVTGEWSDGGL